jgi:hypothetical protein
MKRSVVVILIFGLLASVPISIALNILGVPEWAAPFASVGISITLMLIIAYIVDRLDDKHRKRREVQFGRVLAEEITAEKLRKRKFLNNPHNDPETTTMAVTASVLERSAGKMLASRPRPHPCSGDEKCRVCTGPRHHAGTPVRELLNREERLRNAEAKRDIKKG